MYTDSTSSYKGNESFQYRECNPVREPETGKNRLPKDVLEALEENNYEKALALLRKIDGKESKGAELRKLLKKIFVKLLPFLQMNAQPQKKGEEGNGKKYFFMFGKNSFQMMGKIVAFPVNTAAHVVDHLSKMLRKYLSKNKDQKSAQEKVNKGLTGENSKNILQKGNPTLQIFKQRCFKHYSKFFGKGKEYAEEIKKYAKEVRHNLTNRFERILKSEFFEKKIFGSKTEVIVTVVDKVNHAVSLAVAPFVVMTEKIGTNLRLSFEKKRHYKESFKKWKQWTGAKAKATFSYLIKRVFILHSYVLRLLKRIAALIIKFIKKAAPILMNSLKIIVRYFLIVSKKIFQLTKSIRFLLKKSY